VATRRALVLAGGGIAGIAWETGVLRGIADESPATGRLLLDSEVLVGTSAGSAVAAQIGGGCRLEVLFDRQIAESSAEIDSGVGVDDITEVFLTALGEPYDETLDKTRQQMQRIGAVAVATQTVPEPVDRRGHRRTGGFRPGVGCWACRCGGGQLRGAGGVATGDDRGPTLHGWRGCQLRQSRRGR
jgi:NTE family protein